MKIYAPVENANGVWCNVKFINGVGETDNPHLIEWFKNHGYRLENSKNERVERTATAQSGDVGNVNQPCEYELMGVDSITTVKSEFDDMTPNQLRDYMKENGLGREIKNIRNKEKLIEIIQNARG